MTSNDLQIRTEYPDDLPAISTVHRRAFATTAEAELVAALREQAHPLVSLVAELEGLVVGHVLFSPVTHDERDDLTLLGLAPLAVLPEHQRQGIGSALVATGLDACRQRGADAVVVLGHAAFYPRFGFVPAARFSIRCEYDVPAANFMALELKPQIFAGKAGTVRYHPAFAAL